MHESPIPDAIVTLHRRSEAPVTGRIFNGRPLVGRGFDRGRAWWILGPTAAPDAARVDTSATRYQIVAFAPFNQVARYADQDCQDFQPVIDEALAKLDELQDR